MSRHIPSPLTQFAKDLCLPQFITIRVWNVHNDAATIQAADESCAPMAAPLASLFNTAHHGRRARRSEREPAESPRDKSKQKLASARAQSGVQFPPV
jgi:hypothetical protein